MVEVSQEYQVAALFHKFMHHFYLIRLLSRVVIKLWWTNWIEKAFLVTCICIASFLGFFAVHIMQQKRLGDFIM